MPAIENGDVKPDVMPSGFLIENALVAIARKIVFMAFDAYTCPRKFVKFYHIVLDVKAV